MLQIDLEIFKIWFVVAGGGVLFYWTSKLLILRMIRDFFLEREK